MDEIMEKLLDTCVLHYIETWPGNTESVLLKEEVRDIMRQYSILMCEKQREICAENVEMFEEGYYNSNDDEDTRWAVDKDTIINSPLPEQLL